MSHRIWLLLFWIILVLPCAAEEKTLAGWTEIVAVGVPGVLIHAKMDTGAKLSSLHCVCEVYERQGQPWVKFTLYDLSGEPFQFDLKVERVVRIKKHGGGYYDRPVVRLGLCVGSLFKETEVNLTDRTGFRYKLLIGRDFMEPDIVVDAGSRFRLQPDCGSR